MGMKIKVSSLEQERPRLPSEIVEGERVEFKSSLFFAPSRDRRQVETIAKTIAAFMNSSGGSLYLGVDDDGTICGIDDDLEALRLRRDETVVRGANLKCSEWDYSIGTIDKFNLKISHIVRSYLGTTASALMSDPKVVAVNGFRYVRVDLRPSVNALIYFRKDGDNHFKLYCRRQSEVVELKGVDRDEFVAARIRTPYEAQLDIYMKAVSGLEAENVRLRNEFEKLSAESGLLRPATATAEPCENASSTKPDVAPNSEPKPNAVKWFQRADGKTINPDDIMAPKNRRAVAEAYREGRLKSSQDVLFKYMSCFMLQEMSKNDTLAFLYFIWKNEE